MMEVYYKTFLREHYVVVIFIHLLHNNVLIYFPFDEIKVFV